MIDIFKNRIFQVAFAAFIAGITTYAFTSSSASVETAANSEITNTSTDMSSEKTVEVSFESKKDDTVDVEDKNSNISNTEDDNSADSVEE